MRATASSAIWWAPNESGLDVAILALLAIDYVSRPHEIEIRPSSVRAAFISIRTARISFKI